MRMKTVTILAIVFFAMGAASQDVVQSPTQAQCTFSDGTSIAFSYLLQHQRYRLSTNGPLLTTQGTTVPAGDYTVYLEKDSHQQDSEDDETVLVERGCLFFRPLCQ
jgi:hypothetical protein